MRYIGNVEKDAQVRAVASGALSNGDTIIVNSDGTVSAVAETSVSLDIGSPSTFESASTTWTATTFDSVNNKIVVAYTDEGNSNYGTAVVGTVSGTSISFGTPVVFETATAEQIGITFDSSNGKVVIVYGDGGNSDYGTAVVGTVSGTSISFGTPVVFNSANSRDCKAVFDSSQGSIVVVWKQDSDSSGRAIAGTVSGTSISFGSSATFQSTRIDKPILTYDSTNNKAVVFYADDSNDNRLTAYVITVSGTSISFGTKASMVFKVDYSFMSASVTFDSGNGKIVVIAGDGDNSKYPTAVVCTVSGTTLSFGSKVVINASLAIYTGGVQYDSLQGKVVAFYPNRAQNDRLELKVGTVSGTSISFGSASQVLAADGTPQRPYSWPSTGFDSNEGKVVFAYQDQSTNYGDALAVQNAGSVPNLTSDNFIGFADGAYADTQSAVINTTCSVDRSQTGLTAGQKYYVQNDGSLGLTADDPSVEAGTAISSTEILVKG